MNQPNSFAELPVTVLAQTSAASNEIHLPLLLEMGHELRAPLQTILGYSDLLRDQLQRPTTNSQEMLQSLDAIASSGNYLLGMLHNMLELAKLDQGKFTPRWGNIALDELVLHLDEQLRPLLNQQENQFSIEIPPILPSFRSDRQRLLQILINLLTNAAKFTHRGFIRLEISLHAGQLVFSVRDNGVGMSAEQLSQLFEPFNQHQTTEHQAPIRSGAGLGLFISRQLAQLIGGELTVHSTPEQGSEFLLRIPMRLAESAEHPVNQLKPFVPA